MCFPLNLFVPEDVQNEACEIHNTLSSLFTLAIVSEWFSDSYEGKNGFQQLFIVIE